jgi:hypothetical protein
VSPSGYRHREQCSTKTFGVPNLAACTGVESKSELTDLDQLQARWQANEIELRRLTMHPVSH